MDNNELMKATPEWMAENYDRFNKELFNNELGSCNFGIFTTGRGSQGRTLGLFSVKGNRLYVDRRSRKMYSGSPYNWSDREYINRKNFEKLAVPTIQLNGNYSGTEHALQETLVHEMCHYYDYMYGIVPKQGHGPSFRYIAQLISNRSNGMFNIKRLLDAETFKEYKLSDEMKQKNEKRLSNKKLKTVVIVVYLKNGQINLSLVSSDYQYVILRQMFNYYETGSGKGTAKEIIVSQDPELIQFLFEHYKKVGRTWRYWEIQDKPWVDKIKSYQTKSVRRWN